MEILKMNIILKMIKKMVKKSDIMKIEIFNILVHYHTYTKKINTFMQSMYACFKHYIEAICMYTCIFEIT